VKLQQLAHLQDDVLRRAVLLLPAQFRVGAIDLHQLVSDVILGPHVVHQHIRPDRRRRDGQHGDEEPLGPRVLRVEAQGNDVVV